MRKSRIFIQIALNSILAFFAGFVLSAQTTGCIEGNCTDGSGVMVLEDGSRYAGEFKAGLREGRAVFTWTDGSTWEGQFADNARNGWGTEIYADGTTKTGIWEDDIYMFPNQDTYHYDCDEFCKVLKFLIALRLNSFAEIRGAESHDRKIYRWKSYYLHPLVELPCTQRTGISDPDQTTPDYSAYFGSFDSVELAEPRLQAVFGSLSDCLPEFFYDIMDRTDGYTYITIGQTFVEEELQPMLILRILDNLEGQPEVLLKIIGGS